MKPEFHLESLGYEDEYFLWFHTQRAVLRLSTIKLPTIGDQDNGYETCIFFIGKRYNEVLARYDTLEEAVDGHRMYQRTYHLTPKKFVL